jgi:hypothetical protein
MVPMDPIDSCSAAGTKTPPGVHKNPRRLRHPKPSARQRRSLPKPYHETTPNPRGNRKMLTMPPELLSDLLTTILANKPPATLLKARVGAGGKQPEPTVHCQFSRNANGKTCRIWLVKTVKAWFNQHAIACKINVSWDTFANIVDVKCVDLEMKKGARGRKD